MARPRARTNGLLVKRAPTQNAIIAAATRINVADRHSVRMVERVRQAWQSEAFAYFDEIGPIKYALGMRGQSVSQVRWYAAVQPDPSQDPVDAVEVTAPGADLAVQAMERLHQAEGGLGGIMGEADVNLSVAGEGYLFGTELSEAEGGGELWDFKSIDEVYVNGDRTYVREAPGGTGGDGGSKQVTEEDFLLRIWSRHPRYSALADSPMRGVLADAEEYLILSRMMRGQGRSRLNAGIFYVPDEMSFGPMDPTSSTQDGEATLDAFLKTLTDAMMEPVHDEGSATAVVPLVVRGPAEYAEALKHITLERPFDSIAADQRKEKLNNIGIGLNLPIEKMLGVGGSNHWSAWLIDENYVSAIKPTLVQLANAVTVGYLRPALRAMQEAGSPITDAAINDLRVWFDATPILVRPNRGQDAKDAYDKVLISGDTARRDLGYTDEDAPDPDEVAMRIAMEQAKRTNYPMPQEEEPRGTPASPQPGEEPMPTIAAVPAQNALAGLADRLTAMDQSLFNRMLVATEAAVQDSLRVMGTRLRSAAQGNATARPLVAGVPAVDVAATLGPALVAALGVTDDDLLRDSWTGLGAQYATWVAATQRKANRALRDTGGGMAADPSAQQDDDRGEGWAFLLAAISALALDRIHNPTALVVPAVGEFDPNITIQPGVVRQALQVAGGAQGYEPRLGTLLVEGGRPAGMVATGERVRQMARESLGAVFTGWVWVHGDPDRPFEPHEALDGAEFATLQDDVLVNNEAFPDEDYYWPGDHFGCSCMLGLAEIQQAA